MQKTKRNGFTYAKKQKEKQKEWRAPHDNNRTKISFILINDVFHGKSIIVKFLLFNFITKLDSPEGFSVEESMTTVHKDEVVRLN